MKNFFGINAFVDDPITKLIPFDFVREYQNWRWTEGGGAPYTPGNVKFAPTYVAAFNFDNYYNNLSNAFINVSPCIQQSCNWLNNGSWLNANKPLDTATSNSVLPQSYSHKASHLFQFAARYGSTIVPDAMLKLAPGQARLSGVGKVGYIENWNEPDGAWLPAIQKFTPQEFAAMSSAVYDGHENKLGVGYGIKNADPNMKLVLGGLAHDDTGLDYVNRISNWCIFNRADKKICLDVLNVHIYGKDGTKGISPEAADFKGKIGKWVKWRNLFAPQCELWVSEFGWDTHPESPLAAPIIGEFDRQEVQAQWIIRAYLEFASIGVDKAQVFMLRDNNPASKTKYDTCGLVGPKGDWKPKKAWYYMSQVAQILRLFDFDAEIPVSDPNISILKFSNKESLESVYALWCRTSNGTHINNFQLPVPSRFQGAYLSELKHDTIVSDYKSLDIINGNVSVNISERPIFISMI